MYCGFLDSKVIDSRPTDEGSAIRRRRECLGCSKRFTTYEKLEEIPIMVVKKDGRREPFDIQKIIVGVHKACEKRPIPAVAVDKLVDEVVKEVFNSLEQEITSHIIGELIIQRLKVLDEVAYVRFASVYRQFHDINSFMIELKALLDEAEKEREH